MPTEKTSAQRPELAIFVYFSQYLGRPIFDVDNRPVGRLWDLSVRLGEPFPRIREILIRPPRSEFLLIAEGSQVKSWTTNPITLSVRLSDLRPSRREDKTEILLREALLDKQVVDVSGAKVERVNDLSLLIVSDNEMRLAHIDVGLRGLVRRLGWERSLDAVVRAIRPGSRYLAQEQLVGWKYVVPTVADPAGLRLALSQRSLSKLHPADLAEILEDLPPSSRRTVFDVLELDTAARVLSEVDPELQEDLLAHGRDPEKAADLLETMPPDAAADTLAELAPEEAQELLARMEPEEARAVSDLMHHEEDTAGGLMTTEFVSIPQGMTVESALRGVRSVARAGRRDRRRSGGWRRRSARCPGAASPSGWERSGLGPPGESTGAGLLALAEGRHSSRSYMTSAVDTYTLAACSSATPLPRKPS